MFSFFLSINSCFVARPEAINPIPHIRGYKYHKQFPYSLLYTVGKLLTIWRKPLILKCYSYRSIFRNHFDLLVQKQRFMKTYCHVSIYCLLLWMPKFLLVCFCWNISFCGRVEQVLNIFLSSKSRKTDW